MRLQPLAHVVGVEDSHLGGTLQTTASHHLDENFLVRLQIPDTRNGETFKIQTVERLDFEWSNYSNM